jgi:putative protein kinase ArgK-like GTPase of G3E family
MQKNSSGMFIAIIVMSLAALFAVNKFQEKNTPKTEAQMEAEQQKETEAQQKKQADQTKLVEDAAKAEGASDDLVMQDGELNMGDPKAQHEMVLAYEWTPEIQNDPMQVTKVLRAMKGMPKMRIRVVNADANGEMAPGLYMDGKFMTAKPFSPGVSEQIFSQLQHMIK